MPKDIKGLLFCVWSSAIIDRVRNRETPVFRPVMSFDSVNDAHGLDLIMHRCWTESPSARPSFDNVDRMMKKLSRGK